MNGETAAPPSPAPPENVLPGATDTAVLLRLDDGVAVGLTALAAYPQGFTFELWLYSPNRRTGRGVVIEPAVIVVRYADGRSGETPIPLGPPRPRAFPAGAVTQLLVLPRQASSGPGPARQQVWVSPLPSEGPVEVTVNSPDGRRLAGVELDGAELLGAAARAIEVHPAGSGAPAFDAASAPPLPPAGEDPEQPGEALLAVRHAFGEAFTAGRDGFGFVQDGAVLRAPGQQAAQRWPDVAATLRVGLGEVVFLDAVRAAVQYQLSWGATEGFGPQLGYAVRERGTWKVARGTYCRLLDAAGVQYPPEPPSA